jgi:hypothetical protein
VLRRVLPIATLAIVGAAALALFVTPPAGVLRALAYTFPSAILTGSETDTGATRIAKRSLELYVKSALASHLADRIDAAGEPDQVVLARIIDAVRGHVLNQTQVPHPSRAWSPLASGFGYCDQINAAVADVASHFFHDAQIYALYDGARKRSPHTIGRVWSDEGGGWLYFDAFYDVPVVFTRQADGSPGFLRAELVTLPSRGRAPKDVYQLSGWVMNEYRPSVGGQIGVKLANALGFGNIEVRPRRQAMMSVTAVAAAVPERSAEPSQPVVMRATATPVTVPGRPADPSAFHRIVRAYAAARMDHLLSRSPDRSAYLAIVSEAAATRDPRAAEFATAAHMFATGQ